MPNINGKSWAKFVDLAIDKTIIADNGFDCIAPGSKLSVNANGYGWFVLCSHGRHYLHGEPHRSDDIVGFYSDPQPRSQ